MSETQWGDEEPPPKKKSIPTWVWFCGAGCLLGVILLVAGGVFFASVVKDMMDPEQQWQHLAETLPYDERPPELEMMLGMDLGFVGQETYTLQDKRGFVAQFMKVAGKQGSKMRADMFADSPKFPPTMGAITYNNVETGTVEVQGRELAVVRMEMAAGWVRALPGVDEEEAEEIGHVACVDLVQEGQEGAFWLQYTRQSDGGRITDDEIRALFKPFHVGPIR